MSNEEFEQIVLEAKQIIVDSAPKDTGNLAFDSIKVEKIDANAWRIYVNAGDDPYLRHLSDLRGIAPYMPFTNEVWVSARWNGKRNPNEGWWGRACEKAIQHISMRLGGELNAIN